MGRAWQDGFWRLLQGRGVAEEARRRDAVVATAREHETRVSALTDSELAAVVAEADEAEFLAVAREASVRALGMRPFDVQLLGASWMSSGQVVEMATGEGKTLAAAIAAARYVRGGQRVHVASVNDHLAQRDAEWMAPLYRLLGVSVGWIVSSSTATQRRAAYAADVTYAAISEFGFDVLRDRTATTVAELVAAEPMVLLVDEADSVLIDEALVPLVLAGQAGAESSDQHMAAVVRSLLPEQHYRTDQQRRNVELTPAGAVVVESALGGIDLYSAEHVATMLPAVNVALHAQALLHRDVDYLVRDGKVGLINQSRGRVAQRQRWPDGLQAAVEAKEAIEVSSGGEILDSLTVQSLVGRYQRLCGMSGTAVAAGEQLRTFYDLRVTVIPPNKPCRRIDEPDLIYPTQAEKNAAVVERIAQVHATGRPVLVGTPAVADSERLADELAALGVPCVVLNAKNDAEEAAIVAEAGVFGAVTVSTQMAGRGTDIRLGGTDGVDHDRIAELGGLFVIGTARHTSRRLDDQLRGRAGRQGDPGSSVFFVSLDDDLVRRHAPRTDQDPEYRVRHAQRVAEGADLEIHANTWHYHQLTAQHRKILGERREELLRTDRAARDLAESCPDRWAEVAATVDEPTLIEATRQIALFHLDRCWAEHLAMLAELREGIHLWALARERPLTQFHRAAIAAFRDIEAAITERTEQTFHSITITAVGADLDAAGLRRPTSTWTYLVHEQPFGGQSELRQLYGM
ncbi:accessory Sec system translocase SecA2 [Nocardia sp. NPDC058633]|uniref:accessory Sec system translocase SecA2 n=1 Tax=Nocardia sp. NPDC058633 TaxID=3346568 RepID=UPI0036638127